MAVTIRHERGNVTVEPIGLGKSRVSVELNDASAIVPNPTCDTHYPLHLVERLLSVKGPAYLCHEILREEDPSEIQRQLKYDVLSYVEADHFAGRRILDFACGCGASSMALLKLCPQVELVGVDLRADCIEAARDIAAYYGFERATFYQSLDSSTLPPGIGTFDYILMSAVYEHLLPHERTVIMPQLWKSLKPGGVLFLNQTPYRFFPVEVHTTKLPLINYLPDGVALQVARKLSRRVRSGESWESLLRRGIRGASVGEVIRNLPKEFGLPLQLGPTRHGMQDQIDLWYEWSSESRKSISRSMLRTVLKIIKGATGVDMAPDVAIAVRKA